MVKVVVANESVQPVQESEPQALCAAWPADDEALRRDVLSWADAIVIGPGLGLGPESEELLNRVLAAWKGPTLIDADAITSRRHATLSRAFGERPTLVTPHVRGFARLAGVEPAEVPSIDRDRR
jgi:NAD(P)H-hydrate epimerase